MRYLTDCREPGSPEGASDASGDCKNDTPSLSVPSDMWKDLMAVRCLAPTRTRGVDKSKQDPGLECHSAALHIDFDTFEHSAAGLGLLKARTCRMQGM